MSKSQFSTSIWEKIKVVIAALCFILMIIQIKSGIDMIKANNDLPPLVTFEELDHLKEGDKVRVELTKIDGSYVGDTVLGNAPPPNYYFVITKNQKILVLRSIPDTKIDAQISELMSKKAESVRFKGTVKKMTDNNVSFLNIELISGNVLRKNEIKGGTQDAMLRQQIDIISEDYQIDNKYIVATFVGAVLMFILVVLALRKSIKNMVVSFMIHTGHAEEKQLLKKEDYLFENDGTYNGSEETNGEFFVNTGHNLRNEGSIEQVSADLMTHMVSDGDMFYEGGVNEEGNFYVDSENKAGTLYGDPNDPDNMIKKY